MKGGWDWAVGARIVRKGRAGYLGSSGFAGLRGRMVRKGRGLAWEIGVEGAWGNGWDLLEIRRRGIVRKVGGGVEGCLWKMMVGWAASCLLGRRAVRLFAIMERRMIRI